MEQTNMQGPGSVSGELDGDDGGSLHLHPWSRTLLMQKLDHSGSVPSIAGSNRAPLTTPPPGAPPLAVNSAPLDLGSVAQPGMTGMVGLSSTGLAASTAASAIGTPSEYLLMKNMFDPSTETSADFDIDIKDEVQSECSKFGAVRHIYVDKNSAGHVYLQFDHLRAASTAQHALHGRWFGGKMVTVRFLTVQEYKTKFHDST